MKHGTNGGNGGYSRKAAVSKGNPRTPKPSDGGIGPASTRKGVRAEDGTRQNAKGKS